MRTRILAAVIFACCLVGWGSPSDASTRHHDPVSGCSSPSDNGDPACGSGTFQHPDATPPVAATCADLLAAGLTLDELRFAGLPC